MTEQLEDLIDRVMDNDNGDYFFKLYSAAGDWTGVADGEYRGLTPMVAGEQLWEDYRAFGVEIYTNATDYAMGAKPLVTVCSKGCGHTVSNEGNGS